MVFLYSAPIFLSAALLFFVEPMVGRMVLPILGGTPAVWTTCVVFFQAALLAGYTYSHVGVSQLGIRRHAIIHVFILALPLFVLPISLARAGAPPASDNPAPWLLWQLLLFVGAPFFMVATTGPLLQRWFAESGHRDAHDPYFLYAVSNFGSFLALLAYPVFVEPWLRLSQQAWFWTAGYIILIVLIAACAVMLRVRTPRSRAELLSSELDMELDDAERADHPFRAVNWTRRAWWVLLSLVPSSMMLGGTSFITTDLVAIPLLWVLPLAIYLLTIVLAFSRRHTISLRLLSFLIPAVLPLWVISLLPRPIWIGILCHLSIFFLLAMGCHARLAATRPAPTHLTEFYFWMGVGGLLGGLFNTLLAPMLFDRVIEYHLMVVAACMLMPPRGTLASLRRDRWLDLGVPAIMFLSALGLAVVLTRLDVKNPYPAHIALYFVIPLLCFFFRKRPARFGLCFGVFLMLNMFFVEGQRGEVVHRERNFFGAKLIQESDDGMYRVLIHGGTAHGIQSKDEQAGAEPLAYYYRDGPVGDLFALLQGTSGPRRVGVVGLGTGATAAYARPGDRFTFYEIDPSVARLSGPGGYFTFLSRCKGAYEIVLGDGRQAMAGAADHQYDLIIIDAFSSDAIPVHLLCREAVQLYFNKLTEHGIVALHISNQFLDLEPVVDNLAQDSRLVGLARTCHPGEEARKRGKYPSCYAALARRDEELSGLDKKEWLPLKTRPNGEVWTDEYCNVISALKWRP